MTGPKRDVTVSRTSHSVAETTMRAMRVAVAAKAKRLQEAEGVVAAGAKVVPKVRHPTPPGDTGRSHPTSSRHTTLLRDGSE